MRSISKTLAVFFMCVSIYGCVSGYQVQRSTLSVDDRVDVLHAVVSNPYPQCDNDKAYQRVADLSVQRAERVYLQEGKLCQRSK